MKMTKRQSMTLLLLALMVLPITAQKQFTLEDLNFGGNNYKNMVPQNKTLRWWGDQLVRLTADTCWTVNPVNGKEKILFTREKLNERTGLSESQSIKSLMQVTFPYAAKPLVLASNKDERMLVRWSGVNLAVAVHRPANGTTRAVPWRLSKMITCLSPMPWVLTDK